MTEAAKGSGIGQPVRRREDLRLVRGGGRYTADENLPGQVYAVMVRSPHAHARIRSHRDRRGQGRARRARGADRGRLCRGRPQTHPAQAVVAASERGPAAPQRRRAAVRSAALSLADRQGAFRRRSGGDGRCRNRARGQRRRRAHRHRLRRLAGRGRDDCGRAPGCAAGARRRAVECLLRWRAWRRSRDRRSLCPRRPRHPVRDLGAAHHRRADGAARGARRLRAADRPLHRLCRQWRRRAAERTISPPCSTCRRKKSAC